MLMGGVFDGASGRKSVKRRLRDSGPRKVSTFFKAGEVSYKSGASRASRPFALRQA